jgi:hypothetical protein
LNEVPEDYLDFDENLIYTYGGELFTGIGYEESNGRRISEISYLNGKQDGVSRSWYSDGSLWEESSYRQNFRHGKHLGYDVEGRVRLEEVYEYGILLSRVESDAEGEVTNVFELKPEDPQWDILTKFRNHYKW